MDVEALIAQIISFRSGRPGAEGQMLSLLSTSNLFVVSADAPREESDNSVRVSVRIGAAEGRSSAYLFSSEGLLRSWCTKMGWPAYSVQLNGGDLAVVLPKGAWVEIDPGTPHHVILSPKQLERLAEPFDSGITQPADDAGFRSWVPKESVPTPRQPAAELFPAEESAPVDTPAAAEPATPGKKRPFMRSNPTTVFAAPTLDKKTDLESRPRTYTSSNLKKVIRSTKPDGDNS